LPASIIFAAILRAWPGWTRSSRVEVRKITGGYSLAGSNRWYGEKVLMNSQSSVSGLPYSAIHEAPASSLL